ncbi:MAG: hypothetical protein ACJ78Q_14395 [Chloroflexia bacterium]
MAKKSWQVVIEDQVHTVTAEHGYFSGRIKIYVDGHLVLKRFKQHTPWNLGSEHHISLDGHDVAFYIKSPDGFKYVYDLLIDGRSLSTGEQVPAQPQRRVPGWGWLFVAGCVLAQVVGMLSVLQLLDAHPTTSFIWYGAAIVAAIYCLRVSSDTLLPLVARVVRSSAAVGVTLALSATVTAMVVLGNQAYWHPVSPDAGLYSISMPCKAEDHASDLLTGVVCQDANMQYGAWQSVLAETKRSLAPADLIVDLMEGVKHPYGGVHVEVVGEKPLALQGYVGYEYTALHGKSITQSRFYLVDSHIYQISVTALSKHFNDDRAHKFLDSFHLLATPGKSQ